VTGPGSSYTFLYIYQPQLHDVTSQKTMIITLTAVRT
jgi:hypothetical protein